MPDEPLLSLPLVPRRPGSVVLVVEVVVLLRAEVVEVTPGLGRVLGVLVVAWLAPTLSPPVVVEVGAAVGGADVVVVTAEGGV